MIICVVVEGTVQNEPWGAEDSPYTLPSLTNHLGSLSLLVGWMLVMRWQITVLKLDGEVSHWHPDTHTQLTHTVPLRAVLDPLPTVKQQCSKLFIDETAVVFTDLSFPSSRLKNCSSLFSQDGWLTFLHDQRLFLLNTDEERAGIKRRFERL